MAESMPGAANIVGPVLPDQTRATVERFEIVARDQSTSHGQVIRWSAARSASSSLAVDTQPSALAHSTRIDEV
jgi:hypothetical protein